ncbi:MAG: nucleoside hydrolase [Thermomicrobiales bacterium]
MSESRIPVILDVDTGVDDALALALAVASPEAEIVAVTTLAGNVDVGRATANTLTVLDWLGATDVSVHYGASSPLARDHVDAAFVHGENGLGNAEFPASKRSPGNDRGPAAVIRLAKERPGELTLVCLGPLTNLAIALNVEPTLGERLRRVVMMGGAFAVAGNVTPHAEFNVYCDPEAAFKVFRSALPNITVVGLDVTHQTALPRAAWEAAGELSSTTAMLVSRVCRRTFTEREMDGFYLHDPLAVAVALDPTLVVTETGSIDVDLSEGERGRVRLGGGGGLQIAKQVDAERFLASFGDAMGLPAELMRVPPPTAE